MLSGLVGAGGMQRRRAVHAGERDGDRPPAQQGGELLGHRENHNSAMTSFTLRQSFTHSQMLLPSCDVTEGVSALK